jgi:hypothetical protein
MKQFSLWMAVAVTSSVLWSGCGTKEETPAPAPAPKPAAVAPAPAPVAAPAPAPAAEAPKAPANVVDLMASAKDGVAQAMGLAQAGKYQDALSSLQKTATEVQSNPNAANLVNGAMVQVKQMMADAAKNAAGGALGGLGK